MVNGKNSTKSNNIDMFDISLYTFLPLRVVYLKINISIVTLIRVIFSKNKLCSPFTCPVQRSN